LGASIAVFKGDSVLLVERGRPPWRGLWSLPGGGIEASESPGAAALRELKEEAGIDAEIEGQLDAVEVIADDEDGTVTWRLVMFYGRPRGEAVSAASDAANAAWVRLDELEELSLTKGTAALIRQAAGRMQSPGA
jgi:8-oxo-dGTP diphosphatase